MRPAGFLLHSRCAAALQAVPGCVLVCAAWFCSALALPGCVHQPLPHAAAGAQQAGRHMSVVSSCSGRALARSRPTPSLPHAPRAPRLVSSTLLDAMSQCTCATACFQPLALCLACTHSCPSAATHRLQQRWQGRMPDTRPGDVPVTGDRPDQTRCTCRKQHSRVAGSAVPAGPPRHRYLQGAGAGQASDLSLLHSGGQAPCRSWSRAGTRAPPPRQARSPEAAAGAAGASGARATARAAAPAPGCLLGRRRHGIAFKS